MTQTRSHRTFQFSWASTGSDRALAIEVIASPELERSAHRKASGPEQRRRAVAAIGDGFERDRARRAAGVSAFPTAEALSDGRCSATTATALGNLGEVDTNGAHRRPPFSSSTNGNAGVRRIYA